MAEGVGSGGGKMETTVLEQLKQNKKQTHKKPLSKVRLEGTYLNIIKAIYVKPTDSTILNRQKLEVFSP